MRSTTDFCSDTKVKSEDNGITNLKYGKTKTVSESKRHFPPSSFFEARITLRAKPINYIIREKHP